MTPGASNIKPPQNEIRYPEVSVCWLCGQEVAGDPGAAMRRCSNGHEEVTWNEPLLPGKRLTEAEASRKQAAERWPDTVRRRFGVPVGETTDSL